MPPPAKYRGELKSLLGLGAGLAMTLAVLGVAVLGDGPPWATTALRRPWLVQLLWIAPIALYCDRRERGRPFARGLWASALFVAALNGLVWLKLIRL
jgi:hypothetical protein